MHQKVRKPRGCHPLVATAKHVGKDVPDEIGFPMALARLMKRIRKAESGCWEYTGYVLPKGYGEMSYKSRQWRAHRLMYVITKGPIAKGLLVMHSCDNRRCINPDHLSLGTDLDNIQDAMRKGRPHRGTLELRKTHCPKGHAYAEHARIDKNRNGTPRRACRICQRASTRKRAGWPESHLYIDTQKLGQRPCFTPAA